MKLATLRSFGTVGAALSLATCPLFAQTAPAGGGTGEEAVRLDPFQVQADSDVGFVAASSLAGGRIATALKDTPVAFSVITREFLDAFNITDVAEASNFSVNTVYTTGDNSIEGFAQGPQSRIRVRGISANTPTRNFFPYNNTSDSFNLERVDFARGSNSVLFGSGGAGGTVNSNTKQALTGRSIEEAGIQVGSWNRYRLTADINRPFLDRFAVRANVLWASGDSWRDREWEDRRGVHLTGTWDITSKLKFRAEVEYRDTKRATANQQYKDRLSGWNGVTTYNAVNPAVTAAQMRAAGVTRITANRFINHPAYGDVAYNFRNEFRTVGAAYNATNPTFLSGKQIRTVNFSLNNQGMVDSWDTPQGDRFANASAGSPGFRLPTRYETTLLYPESDRIPTYTEHARDYAAYLTYTPFEGLFLEVAGDMNNSPIWGDNSGRGGRQETYVDIMRTLPNGSPNPGYLRRYSDYLIRDSLREADYENVRFHAAYIRDTRLGKLQFGFMAGNQDNYAAARQRQRLLPLTQYGPDFRAYVVRADQNPHGLYTRVYHDEAEDFSKFAPRMAPVTAVDPITGVSAQLSPTMAFNTVRETTNADSDRSHRFAQIAGNFDLFKNRIILIGAARRDSTTFKQTLFYLPGDMPAGWDGLALPAKPTAPADYWDMTFFPKNANGIVNGPETPAVFRPRSLGSDFIERGQPQYANDRFRDDYTVPPYETAVNTRTFGAVVNILPWLGVFANDSTTFDLNPPRLGPEGEQYANTQAQSYDAGVRFTLPNGKLAVSLSWFKAYQEGATINIDGPWRGVHNSIAAAPVVGDLSSTGRNTRGVRTHLIDIASTATNDTTGYEAEITANLTPNWRLMVNLGSTDANRRDAFPNMAGYFARMDPILRQVMTDAGAIIDANNVATINPALDDPALINQDAVESAVNAWNRMQTEVLPDVLGRSKSKQRTGGSFDMVGNVATDYRFRAGRLRGLRAGFSVNYRGPQVIGSRVNDTIPDPNNPLRAIDDPTVDENTYFYSERYFRTTGTLSYTFRLGEGRRYLPDQVQVNLTVDNLLGHTKPLFNFASSNNNTTDGTFMAPRNNDISNPSRVAIPGNVSYMTPRNYTLSARMTF